MIFYLKCKVQLLYQSLLRMHFGFVYDQFVSFYIFFSSSDNCFGNLYLGGGIKFLQVNTFCQSTKVLQVHHFMNLSNAQTTWMKLVLYIAKIHIYISFLHSIEPFNILVWGFGCSCLAKILLILVRFCSVLSVFVFFVFGVVWLHSLCLGWKSNGFDLLPRFFSYLAVRQGPNGLVWWVWF